jgi:hypothetical protein
MDTLYVLLGCLGFICVCRGLYLLKKGRDKNGS